MKTVSITEAKNHFSAFIHSVKQGESVLILERNHPVAWLEPATIHELSDDKKQLALLQRKGIIQCAKTKLSKKLLEQRPPKSAQKVSILQTLLQEREDAR